MTPPWPRLFIGCGRQSIPFSLAVKRASAGRTLTVQCQNPRVAPAKFDLVIAPEHDGLKGRNVFSILGSSNRITPARLTEAREEFAGVLSRLRLPRVAVLIGGANRYYRFGEAEIESLVEALRGFAKTSGLMITTSRRTGAIANTKLQAGLAGSDAYIWDGAEPSPYLGLLAWADAVLVTADSVNMACEAGATGKPVHIFPLPGNSAKFDRFHRALTERGVARPFQGALEQWSYQPLDETGRAAARIKSLLDLSRTTSDINA